MILFCRIYFLQRTQITYLFLLLIEVVNDDTNEQVQGEKGAEDDENNEINVHVNVVLVLGLLFLLKGRNKINLCFQTVPFEDGGPK